MDDTKVYNIQNDEYGYSIYWGSHTRLEAGSKRLKDVQKRRVEIIALSRVLTSLAEKGIEISHTDSHYPLVCSCISTAGRYCGRKIKNINAIKENALDLLHDIYSIG